MSAEIVEDALGSAGGCSTCSFRSTVPGSCHSSCNSPLLGPTDKRELIKMMLLTRNMCGGQQVGPRFNVYAKMNGWASWPVDFDPAWMEGGCPLHSKLEAARQEEEAKAVGAPV